MFSKIIGIFTRPREVFDSLNEKPVWLLPLLVLVVVSILSLLITYHSVVLPEQMARLTEMGDLTEQQLREATAMIGGMKGILLALVNLIFTIPIFLFIRTALFLIFSLLLGGEATFRKVLSVSSWALLIEAARVIVTTPIMLLRGTSRIITSPALFFPFLSDESLAFRILNSLNFFTIWELALVGLGLSIVSKFSTKKGITVVFSLWVIWIIVTVIAGNLIPGV